MSETPSYCTTQFLSPPFFRQPVVPTTGCNIMITKAFDVKLSISVPGYPHLSLTTGEMWPFETSINTFAFRHGWMTNRELTTDISYLVGSKLHSGFSFHQSCIYLHNYRLYGIGTAPALKKKHKHLFNLLLKLSSYFIRCIQLIYLPVLWEVPCTRPLLLVHNWKEK